jgi:uncharacterized protein with PIN domain
MNDLTDHPYFDDGAWRCVKCGGKLLEIRRNFSGEMTSPRKLLVYHVFGRCGECGGEADWTETAAWRPRPRSP